VYNLWNPFSLKTVIIEQQFQFPLYCTRLLTVLLLIIVMESVKMVNIKKKNWILPFTWSVMTFDSPDPMLLFTLHIYCPSLSSWTLWKSREPLSNVCAVVNDQIVSIGLHFRSKPSPIIFNEIFNEVLVLHRLLLLLLLMTDFLSGHLYKVQV